MNTQVSAAQIAQYQQDGFVKLPGFLAAAEVEALREAIAYSVEALGKQKVAGNDDGKLVERDTYYDRVFLQRLNLWKINAVVREVVCHPEVGRMLCQLAGLDGLRMWHDQTLQKQPWANPTAWHLDNPYWSFHSPDALSIWIALDDVTLQNGCLYFLPGSHKIATYQNVDIRQDMAALFDVYPAFKAIEAVPVEMQAGDASVHNGLTAHAAGPNMTPRWRRAMTCAYMPDGATFNGKQNILSDAQVAALHLGDPLSAESHNPLIWPV